MTAASAGREAAPGEPYRSGRRAAAGLLAGWTGIASGFGLGIGIAVAALNEVPPADFPALFGFWAAVYALATLPAAGVAAGVLVATRRHRLDGRRGLALGAGATAAELLCLNLLSAWPVAYRAIAPDFARLHLPVGVLDLFALAVGFAALVIGVERASRPGARARRAGRIWLAAALAGLALLHGSNRLYERPSRIDLAERVAPLVEADSTCRPATGPASGLVVLALDGFTWVVATPLMERGRLPNLQKLLGRSSYGNLEIPFPSYSPVVWASMATGLPREEHGVHGHLRMRIPGVRTWISWGPRLNAFIWWGAANRFLSLTTDLGITHSERIPSSDRKGMALWDVAGASGHKVGVYDWMQTWPVEPVNGYMYSLRGVPPQNAYPHDSLLAALQRVPPPHPSPLLPIQVPYAKRFEEALWLFQNLRPTVMLHLNKIVDHAHDYWQTWESMFFWSLPKPYARFNQVVETSYEYADQWIGRFASSLPDGFVLAIVSDHGYEFDGNHHAFSPPGVIVLSGGPFACGQVIERADVLDVMPTLLATLGLPGLEKMPGRVLEDAYPEGLAPRLERWAEYPAHWRRVQTEVSPGDAEHLRRVRDRLKALGYVN